MARLPLAALLVCLGTSVSAEVRFEMGPCDTISTSPLRIRSSFAVVNLGHGEVCEILLTRLLQRAEEDSCHVVDAFGPPSWGHCVVPGGAVWHAPQGDPIGYEGCILPGQRLEGLSIVLEPVLCVHMGLTFDQVGNWEATLVPFPCDQPVQVESATWGRLKAIYR